MGENAAGLPRINEIIAFLDEQAPELKAELERSGEFGDLLDGGIWGGEESPLLDEVYREQLLSRAKVLAASLDVALAKCPFAADQVTVRIKRAGQAKFAAYALSAAASSGVIATALTAPLAAVIGGCLGLGSSIIGMFAETILFGGNGGEERLRSLAITLLKGASVAEYTKTLLQEMSHSTGSTEDLKIVIDQANSLFAEITEALAQARI